MGEGRMEEVNKAAQHGILLALISAAVFAVFGLSAARAFANLFTTSADIASQAALYIGIVTVFCFGVFVQIVMERIMQATGNAVYNMVMQGIGALVNIILDPILIFGFFGFPAMGILGAAIATVSGQILAMVLGAWIIHKQIPFIHLGVKGFSFSWDICRQIYSVGFPAIIMQSVASVMTLGMNMILLPYSELAISVYSVYAKLQQFIFMPVLGMNSALIAIVGYNFGAQKKQRINQAARYSLIAAVLIMALGTVLFQLAPKWLLGMFNASEEMLAIGIPALKTISLSFVFAGVSIVLCSIFQALDDGMLSVGFSGPPADLGVPLAWLLSQWGGLNVLWLAFVISEGLCMLFSIGAYRRVKLRQIDVLADEHFIRSGSLPRDQTGNYF
ncbi:MAG: MATE family efflux transporter [Holdemania massiliensis]